RHDLGDRRQYAFATDDYGATWRSIAANLPADAPVRVIRQDPREPNVLYAGTENALYVSLDRGARWERLRAGLPVVPVYDVRVQPAANDLLVATHGRGFFVLDDLSPLQQLAAARSAGVKLFPVRDATLWAAWPAIETGDANALPANQFASPNSPSGAVLSFYQKTKAAQRPWIEIVDASGKVVRTLRGRIPFDPADPPKEERGRYFVTNDAGLNRVAWDGNEDGPTRWLGTSFQNAGPATGPEALPGKYTARLHVGAATYEQSFTLADDPFSPWTPEQRAARHAYLTTVFRWIDGIDRALNEIDARLKKKPSPSDRAALLAVRDALSANDLHDEDSVAKPDRIRERVFALTGPLGGNVQPPFEQHLAALDALRPDVAAAYARIGKILGPAFAPAPSPSPSP
ncbi:MAG TPA: hypothetical protein VHT53_09040, partial [Candidatus Elarobacter sp.]|nr:hypothetical protein [Candidatus Elarobacter sp.]